MKVFLLYGSVSFVGIFETRKIVRDSLVITHGIPVNFGDITKINHKSSIQKVKTPGGDFTLYEMEIETIARPV